MPTTITGDPTTVVNALRVPISGVTGGSGTPIAIATTTAHGFSSGDLVYVFGVVGKTAANSGFNEPWPITVTGGSTFTLPPAIQDANAYTSGGACIDVSLSPQFQVPADGDARNASSVNVGFEALADRSQMIGDLSSQMYELIGTYVGGSAPGMTTVWSTTTSGGGYNDVNNGAFVVTDWRNQSTLTPLVDFGDVLDVSFQSSAMADDGGSTPVGGTFIDIAGSFLAVDAGAWTQIPVSGIFVPKSTDNTNFGPQATHGTWTVGGPGTAKGWDVHGAITTAAPNATVTDGGANLGSLAKGTRVSIVNATHPANNGRFYVVSNTTTAITYYNPNAVAGDTGVQWRVDAQPMAFKLRWNASNSLRLRLKGDNQFTIKHYRARGVLVLL